MIKETANCHSHQQDATVLKDDTKRWCVSHKTACVLPKFIEAFGAGFSCTSYSPLNKDATKNATAMDKNIKDKDDPEDRSREW